MPHCSTDVNVSLTNRTVSNKKQGGRAARSDAELAASLTLSIAVVSENTNVAESSNPRGVVEIRKPADEPLALR